MKRPLADRPLRIIHLPVDLGGHALGLAAAQRALGHDAIAVSLRWSALGFNGDICLDTPPGTSRRFVRREWARLRLLWQTVMQADVIHCHFGQTALSVRAYPVDGLDQGPVALRSPRLAYARMLWLRDLPIWRAFGKTVAMSFYGDDIRSIDASIARNPMSHLAVPEIADALRPREPFRGTLLRAVERNIALLYALNPDLLLGLPSRATWLGYSHCDPRARPPLPLPTRREPLRVLHMPTNRAVKGTDAVIAAVEMLRAQGRAIELTLIENQDNRVALAELASHHVLVDQLHVGWYGGVAVEAMAAGRPVVCYIHPGDLALAPAALAAELPIVQADAGSLAGSLSRLLDLPDREFSELGARSRSFIERWHDPAEIAAGVVSDYLRASRDS